MDSPLANLRDLLDRYDAPAGEAGPVSATLDLIDGGPRTLADDHLVPGHVTASAFVVDASRSRLLLIHHARLGKWLQPGGHVDEGEYVLAAAIREVHEETGVEGAPLLDDVFDVDVHPIPASGDRPPHYHYDVRFLLEARTEVLVETDEVLGVGWVSFAEVADLSTDASLLRAVDKLQGLFGEAGPGATD